jgi:hypothetical protein
MAAEERMTEKSWGDLHAVETGIDLEGLPWQRNDDGDLMCVLKFKNGLWLWLEAFPTQQQGDLQKGLCGPNCSDDDGCDVCHGLAEIQDLYESAVEETLIGGQTYALRANVGPK